MPMYFLCRPLAQIELNLFTTSVKYIAKIMNILGSYIFNEAFFSKSLLTFSMIIYSSYIKLVIKVGAVFKIRQTLKYNGNRVLNEH